jgi:large subunit ribosomal protein L6
MSRVGKKTLSVPQGVTLTSDNGELRVKGPKGELAKPFNARLVDVVSEDGTVRLELKKETKDSRALWGTYAAHLRNMLQGVSEGYEKKLELIGVGYRAEVRGNSLVMSLGYSHPIELLVPAGISASVEKNTISLTGFDKDALGQFAALVRKQRPPEPYKGKGIRYVGEKVRQKEGKKSV